LGSSTIRAGSGAVMVQSAPGAAVTTPLAETMPSTVFAATAAVVTAGAALAEQMTKTKETLDYLESLETMASNAFNEVDLHLVQEELEQSESNKKAKMKPVKKYAKKEKPIEPRQFKTPAGHTILVGRNNIQNDRLTFKIADPTDWWFHTQKIPGSHVILRPKPGIPVDDESLNYACQLAAYFSKAKNSTKIPVDYAQRKYVKKPPAAKPGFVIYDFFKTAIITPDVNLLESIGVPKEP
jgi:predicted ribosome quality control (RQC) complex YloA/Tae2 family protein